MGERGCVGRKGVKGGKWDNCSSIINKYILKKDGHFIMIMGTLHEEDMTLNIYAPNQGALKYIKQLLTEVRNRQKHNHSWGP